MSSDAALLSPRSRLSVPDPTPAARAGDRVVPATLAGWFSRRSAVRADADRPPDVRHGRPAPGAEEDAVQAAAAHTDRLAVDREAPAARSRDRPGDRDPAAVAALLDRDPSARLRRAHRAGEVHPAAAP